MSKNNKKTKRITEFFNLPKGHKNIGFVDVALAPDTALFIDPWLIEIGTTEFCLSANDVVNDYFNTFYALYRTKTTDQKKDEVFCHAHEINATKLGYGSGRNGKAKTKQGMRDTFKSLEKLSIAIMPLEKAGDLPVFIKGFAEDCLSDMLTNILFLQLCEFTIKQCKKYGISTEKIRGDYYYWDNKVHNWEKYKGNACYLDGELVLLVPKSIVCKKYFYNAEQYFRTVVLSKMQDELSTRDKRGKTIKPTKKQLRKNLIKSPEDKRRIVEEKTKKYPQLLADYHQQVGRKYEDRLLSDKALDKIVY